MESEPPAEPMPACNPSVMESEGMTCRTRTFRTGLWTGTRLQLTVMCIPVGQEIGLECHPNTDQFLRIEEGYGMVKMGAQKESLTFCRRAGAGDAILVPAGCWHNLVNVGCGPLKLYSIYAPPQHPEGTVHCTKKDAENDETHSH